MTDRLSRHAPIALAVLRIVAGLLFMEHGTQKLFGFPDGEHAGVAVGSLPWIAGLLELGLGALIALGLFTRPAAFIASGEMAVAYWLAHAPQNFFPVNNGGCGHPLLLRLLVSGVCGPRSAQPGRARASRKVALA
jgi:putative oxidoreductase